MPLSYPPLAYPFPSAINPYAEAVEYTTIAWAQQYGLAHDATEAERIRRQQLHIFSARCHPQSPLTALQWINDWYTWGFLFDDQCDKAEQGHSPKQLTRFQAAWLAMLHGSAPALDDPLSRAFANLATRLRAQVSPTLLARFIQLHADYFAACTWEATNRAQHQIPDLATYLRIRPYALGGYIMIEMNELGQQHDLPAAVRVHPTVQRLALSAINSICWCNDILSLDVELQRGEPHNLVVILHHVQQCSLANAVHPVVARHDTEVQRFQTLTAQLPSFSPEVDADLQWYIAGLQSLMCGHRDWALGTPRYHPQALDG